MLKGQRQRKTDGAECICSRHVGISVNASVRWFVSEKEKEKVSVGWFLY